MTEIRRSFWLTVFSYSTTRTSPLEIESRRTPFGVQSHLTCRLVLRRFRRGTRRATPVARRVLAPVPSLSPRRSSPSPEPVCDGPCCLRTPIGNRPPELRSLEATGTFHTSPPGFLAQPASRCQHRWPGSRGRRQAQCQSCVPSASWCFVSVYCQLRSGEMPLGNGNLGKDADVCKLQRNCLAKSGKHRQAFTCG